MIQKEVFKEQYTDIPSIYTDIPYAEQHENNHTQLRIHCDNL